VHSHDGAIVFGWVKGYAQQAKSSWDLVATHSSSWFSKNAPSKQMLPFCREITLKWFANSTKMLNFADKLRSKPTSTRIATDHYG
jgi:hypothetical protein